MRKIRAKEGVMTQSKPSPAISRRWIQNNGRRKAVIGDAVRMARTVTMKFADGRVERHTALPFGGSVLFDGVLFFR